MSANMPKLYSLRASPACESISNLVHENFKLQIDMAISTRNYSNLEKPMQDYVEFLELAPNQLSYLQEQRSFYPALLKYVSRAQYDCIVAFLNDFLEKPNSELFITDEIFLCHVACLHTIDPHGFHDKCAGMIADRKLRSPDLDQHFDTLMLSDPGYTEFYRPLAQFFKQKNEQP